MTREELRDLAEGMDITLDGKPAILAGYKNKFITIAALDRSGAFEISDRAIESVLTTKNGAFKS